MLLRTGDCSTPSAGGPTFWLLQLNTYRQNCCRAPGRLSPVVLHPIQLNTTPWSIHNVQLSIFILNNGEARRINGYFNLCFAYIVLVHHWFAALETNLLYVIAFPTPSPCWQGYDELRAVCWYPNLGFKQSFLLGDALSIIRITPFAPSLHALRCCGTLSGLTTGQNSYNVFFCSPVSQGSPAPVKLRLHFLHCY